MCPYKAAPFRKLLFCAFIFMLTLLLAACQQEVPSVTPTPTDAIPIDPAFLQMYNLLGGRDLLGEPISPVIERDSILYQYTVKALLMYDPNAAANMRFQIAPLGLAMGVGADGVQELHVGDDFQQLYQSLGETFVGRPLTEVRYNEKEKRYEQFFEKLGFYRMESDPPGTVGLLAYGLWACDMLCRAPEQVNGRIDLPKAEGSPATLDESSPCYDLFLRMRNDGSLSQEEQQACYVSYLPYLTQKHFDSTAFLQAVSAVPPSFAGKAVTEPFLGADGLLEQILENVVVVSSAEGVGGIALRPVPELVGLQPGPMETAADDPMMVFFPLQNGLGYNVPGYFLHFLKLYGGIEFSGPPITGLQQIDETTYQQCFTNLCVLEQRELENGLSIRLAPLGLTYKQLKYPDLPAIVSSATSDREVSLQVWTKAPTVPPNQEQVVGVAILQNDQPLLNIEPILQLTLPDGTRQPYTMPPTGPDGQSSLTLPPIPAPNGTILRFQVCVFTVAGEKFCVRDSYLIWNNP